MIELFKIATCISIASGVIGYVYICILQQQPNILSSYHKFLTKVFNNDKRYQEGKDEHWLFFILGRCEKCFSGQVALWSYLAFAIHHSLYSDASFFFFEAFLFHIYCVCAAILTSHVLNNTKVE